MSWWRSRFGVRAGSFPAWAALMCLAAGPCFGASPEPAASPQAVKTTQGGLVVAGASGREAVLSAADLARLPVVQVAWSFETEHGARRASFEGPLLWTLLDHAGALDPKPRKQAHEAVLITGSDGYTSALALGEVAPAFENKQVILAEQADGQPLGAGHFRLVVPGDRYGGRGVRDVVRITVVAPEPAPAQH
jgi:DMSO/TMAO reductase YedYZ molybdopterin-dependent catalytic subunit